MDTGVCEVTLRLRGKMKCMQKHDDTDLAVIETRVSDARQMDGTHKFQEWECRGLAKTLGVEVPDDAVWNTTMSGSIAIRENFADILKYIDGKKGGVKYYLCYSIERFTRGGPAVYEMMKEELRKRGVQIRDVQGVIQPYKDSMENLGFRYAWSQYSPSETNELVEAGRGRSNKRDMLTRMIGKEILNANEGYAVHSAPDGYINDTESYFEDGKRKKRTIRHHDSERASFYEEMFRLRAEGQKTDDEIVQTINARGFRTKVRSKWNKDCSQRVGTTGGLPLTVKLLQTKIQQLSYAGVNCEEWTHWKPVWAKWSGIVSVDTWNRANRGRLHIRENTDGTLDLLKNYTPEDRSHDNPNFPHKFVRCPTCGKPVRGSSSRSKSGKYHDYYHCDRKINGVRHPRFGMSKKKFEAILNTFVLALRFRPKLTVALCVVLTDRFREQQAKVTQTSADVSRTI